jgi:hypothetical protein
MEFREDVAVFCQRTLNNKRFKELVVKNLTNLQQYCYEADMTNGGDVFQIRRVVAYTLNKQSLTADKRWSSKKQDGRTWTE